MRVSLNLFSGRPNPRWPLSSRDAAELVDRVTAGALPVSPDEPAVLGFRGFTVEADPADVARRADLPTHFVVPLPAADVGPSVTARSEGGPRKAARTTAATEPATAEVSQWLLGTAEHFVADNVIETAAAAISDSSRSSAVTRSAERSVAGEGRRERRARTTATDRSVADTSVEPALEAETCDPFLTPVQVPFWNYPPVRFSNNCYNYASNFASNTIAQPGRRAGRQYNSFDCGSVAIAAGFDGFVAACHGTVRVVALGIWPGFDFHWWRLHPNGFWSHKIGTSPVFLHDNSGRILANGVSPANCDRGPYVQFCGYFFVPLGVQVL
jgi:hypothetical protein